MEEDEIRQKKSYFLVETYSDDISKELSEECVNFKESVEALRLEA